MNLGISVDAGHARAVLMDANGAVLGRGESKASDLKDAAVAVARETLAGANGSEHHRGLTFA